MIIYWTSELKYGFIGFSCHVATCYYRKNATSYVSKMPRSTNRKDAINLSLYFFLLLGSGDQI